MDERKTRDVIMYGFEDVEKSYHVASYYRINADQFGVDYIKKYRAPMMQKLHPEVKEIYLVDNHPGLKTDYLEAYKAYPDKMDVMVTFHTWAMENGIRIL